MSPSVYACFASSGKCGGHAPCAASRHACHARNATFDGPQPVARDVVEVKVLQLVRPDLRLRALDRRPSRPRARAPARSRCRGWRAASREAASSNCLVLHHPAHEILDQRLAHRAVHVVVAHVVADAVGAPAERELRQVAGAEHERVALVGEAEEIIGAQARLHVLERDVVDRLRLRANGWPRSFSICIAAGLMSISSAVTPSAFMSAHAFDFVPSEVAKPGIVKPRMFLRGRPSASNAFAATISACVESSPPETPMTMRSPLVTCMRLREPVDLDVERFVAVAVELGGVVGHERKAVDARARGRRPSNDGSCSNAMRRNAISGWPAAAAALLNVSVRMRSSRRRSTSTSATAIWLCDGKALGARELHAELVDRRLAVPREVGRALAGTRRRVHVRRVAAHRLRRAQHRAIVRLADDDVRRREVAQDQRARRARRAWTAGRRPRSPRRSRRGRRNRAGRSRRTGGRCRTARSGRRASTSSPTMSDARREPAVLVVLAVVGQEGLRRDAEDAARAR